MITFKLYNTILEVDQHKSLFYLVNKNVCPQLFTTTLSYSLMFLTELFLVFEETSLHDVKLIPQTTNSNINKNS